MDSADDLASVRFGLELRRHAKVQVDLTVRRLHPDDLGGERVLEAHHRRFDGERLPVDAERVRPMLERLLQLAGRTGSEEFRNFGCERFVCLADRGQVRFRDDHGPGKLVLGSQDREFLRVHLVEEDIPQ